MGNSDLESQSLGLLPRKLLACEVAILCCLEVDWLSQVELLDDNSGSEVEVLVDDGDQFVGGFVGCPV